MNKFIITIFILFPLSIFGQYLEDFNVANKGVLAGPCAGAGGSGTTCASFDFTGVNWTVSVAATSAGSTAADFFKTVGGALAAEDVDIEFCVTTPILNVSVPATSSFSIAVTGLGFDGGANPDYINVLYNMDNLGWEEMPNQTGYPAGKTIQRDPMLPEANYNETVARSGLVGNTMQLRVCVVNTNSLEDATIASISVPEAGTIILPVSWGKTDVKKVRRGNEVTWNTYSEINNSHFEIERSIGSDGKFELIGKVQGKGNSNQISEYSFLDDASLPNASIFYYRIKQVDFDGKFEYAPILTLVNKTAKQELTLPNPFQNDLTFYSDEVFGGNGAIIITDLQGKLIENIKLSEEGHEFITIDTSEFESGIYIVRFPSGKLSRIVKI